MKSIWKIGVAFLVLAVPLLAAQLNDLQAGPVEVSIDAVTVKDVTSDRVRFNVESHVTSSRKLKIKTIQFEQMHLGTLPVYLSPIQDFLTLEKGVPTALDPIPLTIYFRDLDSLKPLQDVVREQQASVQGNARVNLDLNLLEHIFGGPGIAHVDAPLKVTAPVEIPGGFIGQTAALATLSAAQLALDLGGSGLSGLRQSQRGWESELRSRYTPAIVIAESRYSIRLRGDKRVDFVTRGLGFRISPDRFVLTGEMIEPWKYDPDVTAALQTGDASLLDDGRDLLVWPTGGVLSVASARALSRGAIQVEHIPARVESTRVAVDRQDVKVQLARRNTDANYAVLRFTRSEDKGPAAPSMQAAGAGFESWDRLTIFRADENGRLEFISTPAHRQNGRVILEDSVDDHAYGSLLISPRGPVGMLQDENSGMPLRNAW